ncbi:MAG: DNA mismatch repair protein MutS, partial [Clostridia bacterium]|nr:DNA mismatch repair protein MutS [Clostridia bacterium]
MPISPLMKQYLEIKQEHPECILMCRIGDFYEMFYEDAQVASKELDLVLTGKDCGQEQRAPMCGVPFHAAESYIAKLVSRGYRVAICEQMEDPALAKGLVKREVIRIITPGTVTEGGYLDEGRNNYIASLWVSNGAAGIAFADVSTGEVRATDVAGDDLVHRLLSESAAFAPSELVCPEGSEGDITAAFTERFGTLISPLPAEDFSKRSALAALERVYKQPNREGSDFSVCAAGALITYIERTQKRDLSYLNPVEYYSCDEYMGIDGASRRNLEITETMRAKQKKGSLLWAVDRTRTGAGARLLRARLEKPLVNETAIRTRLEGVKELYSDGVLREELRESLKEATDVERIMTRLVYGTANARDLNAVARTAKLLPGIKELLSGAKSACLKHICANIDTLEEVYEAITKTIDDDPAPQLKEGGIIRPGCNAAVDELRDMVNNGKQWIARIEEYEKEKTGIKSLKIG